MTHRDCYHPFTLHKLGDDTQLDANEDYSSAGGYTRFVLEPDADSGEVFGLVRLSQTIHDDDNDYNKLGNLPAIDPSDPGIRIIIENSETLEELVDLTAGREIRKTSDLDLIDADIKPLNSGADGTTRAVRGVLTLPEHGIPIRGRQNERLAVLVPAIDFSSLEFFSWLAGVNVSHSLH